VRKLNSSIITKSFKRKREKERESKREREREKEFGSFKITNKIIEGC